MLDATPLMRLYARARRARLAAQDPAEAQARTLMRLVHGARRTRFGRDHGFGRIASVDDFRRAVPLRSFEAFWERYWGPAFPELVDCTWPGRVPYFALTSGTTTGRSKHVPVTRAMCRSNAWAGADLYVHHLAARPQSRVIGGLNFMLGGSTDLTELAPGVLSGDLSGIAAREIGWPFKSRFFPPLELALIADWEEKIERLADAVEGLDVRTIAGTPSWLLLFFDRLFARRPEAEGRLAALFPNLALMAHGAVNFAPYRARFAALLAGSRAETREVYAASEGFLAVADRGDGEGMRLLLDTGLFTEFVPLDELGAASPTRHGVGEIEPGVDYAVAVTSCAGLWAYLIGDVVRFVDTRPPRLLIAGRSAAMLSAFGEHLIEAEIDAAVAAAAAAIGATVNDFAVGAVHGETGGDPGGHLYLVEFAEPTAEPARVGEFAERLDRTLAAANDDYRAHRARGFGMRAPEVRAVPPGFFAAWMKRRGQLGGQHKVPRIVTDPALFDDLLAAAGGGQAERRAT